MAAEFWPLNLAEFWPLNLAEILAVKSCGISVGVKYACVASVEVISGTYTYHEKIGGNAAEILVDIWRKCRRNGRLAEWVAGSAVKL